MTKLEQVLAELHKRFGSCGHCGKSQCAGKVTYSTLPKKLPTMELLAILDEVLK